MTTAKQAVHVRLDTTITDDGDTQTETVQVTGEVIGSGMKRMIRFTETNDQNESIDTVIMVSEDKVTLKRTGAIHMSQQFIENKKTESHYQHPLMRFRMETYTDAIDYIYSDTDQDLSLKMRYRTVINGAGERTHTLKLNIKGDKNG
ncbi:hypothetical protein GCM10012290_10270 [Halolactibacillus alkaliphilus]|uniref:Beta-barrel protein YwiB n=1 Tax=Halolactibacillus alkaliphilus TaxID=442899 RepID=A0A511X250_9BACI|nr:DUF1934 domain-containing protein [Halolactibacillus alkaliphilus]GEN57025.1 hypothetical protein HAL01_14890 [Halolactibacillus alkaliphilus]GGN68486.1 hypothetical protein GCM10012290_10270 [Halolactibacillus alkaliphilus]SFO85641.1 Uncharacterized beta-barrel protein YwiB, DUF1934 family [Halolactibacillus alkaliphilus]